MVCGIIITIYTLLLLVASLLYVKKRYSIEKGALTRTAFKAYWVLLAITAAVLLLFVTLSIQYSLRNELLKLPVLMRWTTLLWGLYLLAYIDYRERLIPNFLICVLLSWAPAWPPSSTWPSPRSSTPGASSASASSWACAWRSPASAA